MIYTTNGDSSINTPTNTKRSESTSLSTSESAVTHSHRELTRAQVLYSCGSHASVRGGGGGGCGGAEGGGEMGGGARGG